MGERQGRRYAPRRTPAICGRHQQPDRLGTAERRRDYGGEQATARPRADVRPFPGDLAADVGRKWQVSAEVRSDDLAVHPYLGRVVCGPDAEKDSLPAPGRWDVDFTPVPGEAKVVTCVIEEVVPTARHGDHARRRQRIEPSLRFAFLLRVELELPETGDVEQVAELILLRMEGTAAARRRRDLRGDGIRSALCHGIPSHEHRCAR